MDISSPPLWCAREEAWMGLTFELVGWIWQIALPCLCGWVPSNQMKVQTEEWSTINITEFFLSDGSWTCVWASPSLQSYQIVLSFWFFSILDSEGTYVIRSASTSLNLPAALATYLTPNCLRNSLGWIFFFSAIDIIFLLCCLVEFHFLFWDKTICKKQLKGERTYLIHSFRPW